MNVSLIQAWSIWLSGEQTGSLVLWGHPIWWWARIGKIVQFIAALTIIAELIGPERIRRFGNSLHSKFTFRGAIKELSDTWAWLRFWFSASANDPNNNDWYYKEAEKYKAKNLAHVILILAIFSSLALFVLLSQYWPDKLKASGSSDWFIGFIFIALVLGGGFLLSVLLALSITIIRLLSGLVVDFLLIEPVAWLIDREYLDKWIKVISIFLLLVGFHFDLLSS